MSLQEGMRKRSKERSQIDIRREQVEVEDLPRAKLRWTWWSLLLSTLQIALGFLLAKPFPFLVPQPRLPKDKDLHGTITIVTGANSGVGFEIAKQQYISGSHVILACRNQKRAQNAKEKIIAEVATQFSARKEKVQVDENRLEIAIVDCSSLSNVRSFVNDWSTSKRKVDYLFLNAGIASSGNGLSRFTGEGFDLVYVTNHLGPFLLAGLLSPHFSSKVRIILTSSAAGFWAGFSRNIKTKAHKKDTTEAGFHYVSSLPSGGSLYGQSKGMQIVFANILQRKFDQNNHKNKIAASYHPGMVATNIFTSISLAKKLSAIAPFILNIIALTCRQGALGALWLAQTDDGFLPGGFYERDNLIVCPWYNHVSSNGIDEKLWNRWNADAGLQESDWQY